MSKTAVEMEKVGEAFDEKQIVSAKQRTWKAIEAIREQLRPGTLESDAFALTNELLKAHGAEKFWHRSQVRFGANTLKPFGVKPDADTRLAENDIYFLDVGPVFEGHEADCGATFTVGNDPEQVRCARDAEEIWHKVRDRWFETGESGPDLYRFAVAESERRGWVMTLKSADGHRLGDFPHALHYKGKLATFGHKPSPNRWVLEIQIRHPQREFGAFYEDLLA